MVQLLALRANFSQVDLPVSAKPFEPFDQIIIRVGNRSLGSHRGVVSNRD